MVEICDTILYIRCGNPTTDVILTAPVLWAPRHCNTLVTNALNPPKTSWLKEISWIFLSTFQHIHIISIFIHCMHLIFKICQTVAGVSKYDESIFESNFWWVFPILSNCVPPHSSGLRRPLILLRLVLEQRSNKKVVALFLFLFYGRIGVMPSL